MAAVTEANPSVAHASYLSSLRVCTQTAKPKVLYAVWAPMARIFCRYWQSPLVTLVLSKTDSIWYIRFRPHLLECLGSPARYGRQDCRSPLSRWGCLFHGKSKVISSTSLRLWTNTNTICIGYNKFVFLLSSLIASADMNALLLLTQASGWQDFFLRYSPKCVTDFGWETLYHSG